MEKANERIVRDVLFADIHPDGMASTKSQE